MIYLGIDDVTCNHIGNRPQDTVFLRHCQTCSNKTCSSKNCGGTPPSSSPGPGPRCPSAPGAQGFLPVEKKSAAQRPEDFYVHCATSSLVPVLELPGFTHVDGNLTRSATREVTDRQKEGSGTCSDTLLSACRASPATSPTCWGRGWGAHRCHTRCGAHSGCRQPRNKSALRCSGRSTPSSLPPLRQRKRK